MEKSLVNQTNILKTLPQSLKLVVLMVLGSLIIAVSAKIQIPFWPVPMTMQTFVVMMISMGFGWKLGGATMLLYLFEGAVGLPVFAKGAGISYMVGPTGGYLVGMLVASVVAGYIAQRGFTHKISKIFVPLLIGTSIIFLLGVGYLATFVGMNKAIALGLTPFLLSESFKILLAAFLFPQLWKFSRKFKS